MVYIIDYQKKYLKYKKKYVELKNQLGGDIDEIGGDVTPLEPNTIYKFKGIVSCIGLIIKAGKLDMYGGLDYDSAIAIHIIDGVDAATSHHIKDFGLTDIGKEVLDKINTYLDSKRGMKFQITYIYSPERGGGNKDFSTMQLIKILNDNFSKFNITGITEYEANVGVYEFNSKMD